MKKIFVIVLVGVTIAHMVMAAEPDRKPRFVPYHGTTIAACPDPKMLPSNLKCTQDKGKPCQCKDTSILSENSQVTVAKMKVSAGNAWQAIKNKF